MSREGNNGLSNGCFGYLFLIDFRHSHAGDVYWLRSSYKFAFGVLGRAGVPRDSVTDSVSYPLLSSVISTTFYNRK